MTGTPISPLTFYSTTLPSRIVHKLKKTKDRSAFYSTLNPQSCVHGFAPQVDSSVPPASSLVSDPCHLDSLLLGLDVK